MNYPSRMRPPWRDSMSQVEDSVQVRWVIVTVLLSVVSLLIATSALALATLTYIAKSRPFVGVRSLKAEPSTNIGEMDLMFEVQNVGEVPAVGVVVTVTDSGGAIKEADFVLGAMFPGAILPIRIPVPEAFTYMPDKEESHLAPIPEREGVEEYVMIFPEGYEATLVTYTITYKNPTLLGFIPGRTFRTVQPFHVDHFGRSQPARSKTAEIS